MAKTSAADGWGLGSRDGLWTERLKMALAAFGCACLLSFFAFLQFRGFVSPAAMEFSQLARNVACGRGLVTDCLRPEDLARLAPGAPLPELRQAPLYPLVAGAALRVLRPDHVVDVQTGLFRPETRVLVPLGLGLTLGAGFCVFLLARRLFGLTAGVLALAVVGLSDRVLTEAIGGTAWSLAALLAAGACGCMVAAVDRIRRGVAWQGWSPWVAGAGVCLAGAMLTEPLLVLLWPALSFYFAMRINRFRVLGPSLLAIVVVALVVPWLWRNVALGGPPLGRVLEALAGSDGRVGGGVGLWRQGFSAGAMVSGARAALLGLGGGLGLALFAASFFARPDDDDAQALRWVLLAVAGGLLLLAGLLPVGAAGALRALLPLGLALGCGFLVELLERTVGLEEGTRRAALVAFVLVCALPLGLRLGVARPVRPYPPYAPSLAAYVGGLMDVDEILATDIPWATAWYGGRRSLLLPRGPAALVPWRAAGWKINGLYLTTETGDKPYLSELVNGPDRDWLQVLNRRVPPGLPLTNGLALPPGSTDQLFLTDRIRW